MSLNLPPGDMPAEEFRRFGHEVVDWIADYLTDPGQMRVFPPFSPGHLVDALPASGPGEGEPMERILADFRDLIVPHCTLWNHPRFFSYFSVSSSGPGILAEALIATLNMNGMLWRSSPAATELEQVTLGWLREWLGLPERFFGMIHDTASTSTFHAILAARAMAEPESRERGSAPGLVLYTSEQAHSSVEKGALALGIGRQNVRRIPCDAAFQMRPEALGEAIGSDRAAALRPFCVVATVGTTATTAIDPVPAIADICEREGLWLHVDAAYGGHLGLLPERRHVLAGCDRAQSFVVNPHKWLFTPIDLSAFYTTRPDVLRGALSLVPEYLRSADDPRAINFMDYGVPLGRRFRSLKLWFVMRYFGRNHIAAIIRHHLELARYFADQVAADDRFELCAPVPMSLVCFRLRDSDEANRRLFDRLNASGEGFFSHNVLEGRFVLRFALGNIHQRRPDVDAVWKLIRTLI